MADKDNWVRKVMRALLHTKYRGSFFQRRRDIPLTPKEAEDWERWQTSNVNSVDATLQLDGTLWEVEAHAQLILEEVEEIHKKDGGHRLSNLKANRDLKCSERLEAIVSVLQDYAIVRYDVLNDIKLHEFVKNPVGLANAKVSNVWNNLRKRTDKDTTAATVANTSRKTKATDEDEPIVSATQSSADKEDQNEDENPAPGADHAKKRPATKGRATGSIMKRREPVQKRQAKGKSQLLYWDDEQDAESVSDEEAAPESGAALTQSNLKDAVLELASNVTNGSKRTRAATSAGLAWKRSKAQRTVVESEDSEQEG